MVAAKSGNTRASTITVCPDCGKFGLISYFSKISQGTVIRCKMCNSFWTGEEAQKLDQLIEDNSYITQSYHKH